MGISKRSFRYKGVCYFKDVKEEAAEETFLLYSRLGKDKQKII